MVVTLIDDDTLFLSFSHYTKKKITFIAIQNGYRAAWNISSLVNNINFKRRLNRFNKEANLYYFSFGKNELDLFEEYLPSLKVVPVGSLRLSVAEKYYPSHNKMYDICLILPIRQFILESYCRDEWSNFYGADHDKISLTIYKTNLKLLQNLKKYCLFYNKSLVIPSLDNTESSETKFTKNFFKDLSKFEIKKTNSNLASYSIVFNSEVILGTSTMMIESLGVMKKLLQAEVISEQFFTNLIVKQINHLDNSSYSEFEKKMNFLFDISNNKYKNHIMNARKYYISNDIIPTAQKIVKYIKKKL